jgi:hypothetical protein
VVSVRPGVQAGETANVPQLCNEAVGHALVAVAGVDGDLQNARAVRGLDDDGDAGQVLTR